MLGTVPAAVGCCQAFAHAAGLLISFCTRHSALNKSACFHPSPAGTSAFQVHQSQ